MSKKNVSQTVQEWVQLNVRVPVSVRDTFIAACNDYGVGQSDLLGCTIHRCVHAAARQLLSERAKVAEKKARQHPVDDT